MDFIGRRVSRVPKFRSVAASDHRLSDAGQVPSADVAPAMLVSSLLLPLAMIKPSSRFGTGCLAEFNPI
jgi:hypothetical protein